MVAAETATAAAASALLCLVFRWRGAVMEGEEEGGVGGGKEVRRQERREASRRRGRGRLRLLVMPPSTWRESVGLAAETVRFVLSETLGKWPLGDLAFGITHHIRRQGNLEVASEFAGSECVELKGHEILAELNRFLRLLNICFSFSRKTFQVLLESAGCSGEDVLLREAKGRFLKPAFTILRDRNSKTILLLIRGALSVKDKLTAATGTLVPFHHIVLHEGSISNLVMGYAHSGMVVAARWIAKCATPCLQNAFHEHPDYGLKIVGHSMGAGIAAILTYILREHKEFSSSTCIAFGPACCMTWNLAESGKHFVTSVINATDVVPTFSTVSVSNLRNEVGRSSWLKNQIQQTGFLNGIRRSATSLSSCLPSLPIARTKVADTDKLEPATSSSEVVIRDAHSTAKAAPMSSSSLTAWSCATRGRRVLGTCKDPHKECASASETTSGHGSLLCDWFSNKPASSNVVNGSKALNFEIHDRQDVLQFKHVFPAAPMENITEDQFWFVLEDSICKNDQGVQALKAMVVSETEEDTMLNDPLENEQPARANAPGEHHLFPPGRTLHMVASPALVDADPREDVLSSRSIGIYETPRHMYGKIRLSQTMIKDHYMPRYKLMMELLITKFKTEKDACTKGCSIVFS